MKFIEFRCLKCNTLFCKCSIDSKVEVKCRKCKLFYLFDKGKISLLGIKYINNYFKGDDKYALDNRGCRKTHERSF